MADQSPASARRPPRVLLAEDNDISRQVELNILQRMGLSADAVVDGEEALLAVEKVDYDLVLMDLEMPVLDGLQAARAIRQAGRRMPIIALSAHAADQRLLQCKEAGMVDYLVKPLSRESMSIVLNKWLPGTAFPGAAQCAAGKEPAPLPLRAADAPLVFDKAGLLSRLLQDRDFARSVVGVFLDEMPKQLAMLREFSAAGTLGEAERKAHAIKGAAGSIGGCAMSEKAGEVESAARAGDWEKMERRAGELEEQFALLRQAMGEEFGA